LKTQAKESHEEVVAKLCPVFGATSIEHIGRDVLLAAYAVGLKRPLTGAIAYHCDPGHVFLLLGQEFRWEEPLPDGPGYSIVL
jgi:hypothetical protein